MRRQLWQRLKPWLKGVSLLGWPALGWIVAEHIYYRPRGGPFNPRPRASSKGRSS